MDTGNISLWSVLGKRLHKLRVSPNQVTIFGFFIGICAIPCLAASWYWAALSLILINRFCDGLDGQIARMRTATDGGAFLDICLDFIFYSGVVAGFALFLAFALLAEKRSMQSRFYPKKGFYYLAGIAEGTETILFFVLFCLFPAYFSQLAYIFALICFLSTAARIIGGFLVLSAKP